MKIAFFSDTYLPNVDGVVTSMTTFKKALEEKNHEVFVYCSGSRKDKKQNKDARVIYYESIKFPPYPQYKLAVFPYASAKKSVEEKKIELIHCHAIASMGLSAMKTAHDLSLPLVGTFHTMIPIATGYVAKTEIGKKLAAAIAWKAVQTFYTPFNVVTTPSHVIAGLLEEHGVKNVVTVPNGIDLNKFNPRLSRQKIRGKLGLGDEEKLIMVAGRMGLEKNIDVIIKSMKQVRKQANAKLLITGDGPARPGCEKLAKELGLANKVIFEGFVPGEDLPYYYRAADCFVTASTFETQGLALLEAMACGVPGVGANSLAIPESIDDGINGFLFEPFNELECAEKITRVLSASEKEAQKMRGEARKKAEQFSVDNCTEKLLKAYERART
ncbi:MAG: glycosyltransferase [Candidatus Micrarchaeota archaeon]